MLLFEANPPYVCWSLFDSLTFSHGTCEVCEDEMELGKTITAIEAAEAIGYVLPNGGPEVCQPVSRLTPDRLAYMTAGARFSGEAGEIICTMIRQGLVSRPQIPHLLFCETAFFAGLPAVARTYGLPYEWYEQGVRRYGGDGICHQWAWEQVRPRLGGVGRRVLSVHLGDYPNVVALREGIPVDTSAGFSLLEGVFSATGCGDLDPAIVLQLRSAGMTPQGIGQMLRQESGFSALLGRPCDFWDLLRDDTPEGSRVRGMLLYALIKALGAGAAALGGADALVLIGEHLREATGFVLELGSRLGFLGASVTDRPDTGRGIWDFTGPASWLRIVGVPYKRWEALLAMARPVLGESVGLKRTE